MSTLIVIPARAGSKGLPGKNTKLFFGKPLISYTIEFALNITKSDDIVCVSTNDIKVVKIVRKYSKVKLLQRPSELASDTSAMSDVLNHCLNYFEQLELHFEKILLLQPTSIFRFCSDYLKCSEMLDFYTDIVVSVNESKANPYFNLFEENKYGYLEKSKNGNFSRRQDCPVAYEYNGSFYLMKTKSFKNYGLHNMPRKKKYLMPNERSIDIDNSNDWEYAKYLQKKYFKNIDFKQF